MSQAQGPASTGTQKSGKVEQILAGVISHADTTQDLINMLQSLDPRTLATSGVLETLAVAMERLPRRFDTQREDLETVRSHILRVRELATQKGYGDILELLDQPFHYDRNYGV